MILYNYIVLQKTARNENKTKNKTKQEAGCFLGTVSAGARKYVLKTNKKRVVLIMTHLSQLFIPVQWEDGA